MFSINTFDILAPSYNQDITEILDKSWVKSTATSKEHKDKNIHDIFRAILIGLNKNLLEGRDSELSDLILEKSRYICEITGVFEWPGAETLKVPDLHRLTLFFYNYLRNHYALNDKGKIKINKELAFKAFENLVKFIENLVESFNILSEELIFSIFNDFFDFYKKARELVNEEMKERAKEDMQLIIDLIYEETNFKGLIRMDTIERHAQQNYFVGMLNALLAYKVGRYEKENENIKETADLIEASSKHVKALKEYPLVFLEYSLIKNVNNFIFSNNEGSTNVEELVALYKQFKIYRKFKKSPIVNIFFNTFENSTKYVLLIYFIIAGIKIDLDILSFLKIKEEKNKILNIDITNITLVDTLSKFFDLSMLHVYNLNEDFITRFNLLGENVLKDFNNSKIILNNSTILDLIYDEKRQINLNNESSPENKDLLSGVKEMNLKFSSLKASLKLIK